VLKVLDLPIFYWNLHIVTKIRILVPILSFLNRIGNYVAWALNIEHQIRVLLTILKF